MSVSARNAHLFVGDAVSARGIGAGWLAYDVAGIVKDTASIIFLVGEVLIGSGGRRGVGHVLLLESEPLGLVDLVQVFLEKAYVP